MNKNRHILLTAAMLIFLFVGSCVHKSTVEPSGTTNPGGGPGGSTGGGNTNPGDTALCFERDILPIFQSNCAKSGCHDAASAQDGYVFTSYQTITAKKFSPGDPWDTELFEKINEHDPRDIMPPPPNAPLSQDQIGKIYRWIAMGAPNTTGCSSGNCDSSRFTFSGSIQSMIQQYCRGCHNSAGASSGVNLDNYTGVKTVASDGRLIGVIKRLPGYPAMPQGGNKLSDCQIMQVEKWIAAGAQNN